MKTFQIEMGLTISTSGGLFEYTDRTEEELYFKDPHYGKRIIMSLADFWTDLSEGLIEVVSSISTPKALIVLPEKTETIPLISDLKELHLTDLQRKLNYIKGLRKKGVTRGNRRAIKRELKLLSIELNDSKGPPGASTVQKWWKRFDTSLDGNQALISRNAFRRRKLGFDNDSEFFLQDEIQLHYAQTTRPSVTSAYGNYCKDLVKINLLRLKNGRLVLKRVSERTFLNRINALPQKDLVAAREGYEIARKQFKLSKGPLPADYPLDSVEIDHTPMNLYVIDDMAFLPLGRPVLTAIKDRNSKILLGIYITFNGGGLASIAGAIKHSLNSHQLAFVLWNDLEHPWPAFGMGFQYVADRGPDFISHRYQAMILDMGSSYDYCEVRTPWLKGSIERFFLTLEQTFFETLPGKTFSSLAQRKDYDPENQAVIRFSTLVYLMHKWAVDYHNVTPHSRKMATPLELWQEGIGMAPPPMPVSTEKLNIILGTRYQGTIRNEGIQLLNLHYADDSLQQIVDRHGKGIKVDYIVSPEDVGSIHVKDPLSGEYVRINCTRPDYASGLTLYQHKYIRNEAKLYSKHFHDIDSLMGTRQRIGEVVQEEVFSRDNHRKKELARIAAINSNAVLEGHQRTILKPFGNITGASKVPDVASQNSPAENPFTSIPTYQWGG